MLHTMSATWSSVRSGRSSPVARRSAANSRMLFARRVLISARSAAQSASLTEASASARCTGAIRTPMSDTAAA